MIIQYLGDNNVVRVSKPAGDVSVYRTLYQNGVLFLQEEKMPGHGEEEDGKPYHNGNNDEMLDSNPEIDLDYLLQDNSNCGKTPESK